MTEPVFSSRQGALYGGLGLPLAFLALPLYVILPNHYAREFGVPLALLGALLLSARLLDAFIDPLLGRLGDRLFARSLGSVLGAGAVVAIALAAGFAALFLPPVRGTTALLFWAAGALVLTYTAYSLLSITHQAWGAMLGGDEWQRGRIVAWREGLGLVGVVLAALAPGLLGMPATTVLLAIALFLGWLAWSRAPRPRPDIQRVPAVEKAATAASLWHPLRRPAFRRLLAVFMLNGIASAIPPRWCCSSCKTGCRHHPPWSRPSSVCTLSVRPSHCLCGCAPCGASASREPGSSVSFWRSPRSPGPPRWALGMPRCS
jgi:GPH family glycoside/pentoside/hexuronide:cation symporter